MGGGSSREGDQDQVVIERPWQKPPVAAKFKVAIVGAKRVGKSSIFRRYLSNEYNFDYRPTSRVEIGSKFLETGDNLTTLEIWDVPSSRSCEDLVRDIMCQGLDAAVIVTDPTDPQTFQEIGRWHAIFREALGEEDKEFEGVAGGS
jgi:GTPase SAR1 family protein